MKQGDEIRLKPMFKNARKLAGKRFVVKKVNDMTVNVEDEKGEKYQFIKSMWEVA